MKREFRSFDGVLVKAVCAALGLWMIGTLTANVAYAQRDPERYTMDRCQEAVRQRMVQDMGGADPRINFDRPQINHTFVGTQCEGSGLYTRDDGDRGRRFSYSVNLLPGGSIDRVNYRFSGNGPDNYYRQSGDYDRNDRYDRYNRADDSGNYNRPSNRAGSFGGRPEGRTLFSGAIINRNSGKALDVENRGGGTFRGSNVQQWEYANQPNQNWETIDLGNNEVAIVSRGSGMVLNAEGTRNAAIVDQSPWNGSANQRWRLERRGDSSLIVSVSSGRCLDVANQSRDNGGHVQLYDCHGQANQQWQVGR